MRAGVDRWAPLKADQNAICQREQHPGVALGCEPRRLHGVGRRVRGRSRLRRDSLCPIPRPWGEERSHKMGQVQPGGYRPLATEKESGWLRIPRRTG